ncbi:MAG: Mov34/MPN/PAD-1 family protein [Mariniblastus sp.]
MSSEIQFGELEHAEPQRALRPDQDAHFATAAVGEIGDDELLIYVDLDVQRDMEAHALSNTRVELGGVMLGGQYIDDQGKPFVVISDSLRAEHYEATKGSFKFTHETWSQITRQRDEFRPDLEMVGWYHTHPGWSVFLSGMDLFICNNFFNRPLDVALVIDPCEQDRGWFQWTDDDTPKTNRTGGFILTTGRFRQLELEQFARIYSKEPVMNIDPRYSGNAIGGSQPSVTFMDNRKPSFEIAIIGMLMMQFLLMAILAWRFLAPGAATAEDKEKIAKLESALVQLKSDQGRSVREETYREMLSTLVSEQTGDANLVEKFTELKTDAARMQANLDGQLALAEKLQYQRNDFANQLEAKAAAATKLESQLVNNREALAKTEESLKDVKSKLDQAVNADGSPVAGALNIHWWMLAVGAGIVGFLGTALGYILGKRNDADDFVDDHSRKDFGDADKFLASENRDSAFGSDVEPAASRSVSETVSTETANAVNAEKLTSKNVSLTIDGDGNMDSST